MRNLILTLFCAGLAILTSSCGQENSTKEGTAKPRRLKDITHSMHPYDAPAKYLRKFRDKYLELAKAQDTPPKVEAVLDAVSEHDMSKTDRAQLLEYFNFNLGFPFARPSDSENFGVLVALAYEKAAQLDRGLVLLYDGSSTEMSASELKEALIARAVDLEYRKIAGKWTLEKFVTAKREYLLPEQLKGCDMTITGSTITRKLPRGDGAFIIYQANLKLDPAGPAKIEGPMPWDEADPKDPAKINPGLYLFSPTELQIVQAAAADPALLAKSPPRPADMQGPYPRAVYIRK